MAEGDITFYNYGKDHLVDGEIDCVDDTIKLALVKDTYTPDIDTHDFWDDVSSHEISASGYTAGGATLANKSSTVDAGNDEVDCDADDVTWSNLAAPVGTVAYAICYKDTGVASTSPLLFYMAITQQPNGTDYTVQWNAGGVFSLA